MSVEHKSFFEVFPKYPRDGELGELLEGTRVIKTLISREQRRLRASLLFSEYISCSDAEKLGAQIKVSYNLSEVSLRICCHSTDIKEHIEDFFEEGKQDIPALSGFFNGEYALEEDTLSLAVSFSGSGLLHNMGCEDKLEELFLQKFGRPIRVVLSDRIEEKVSYEEFEKKVSEGVDHTPAPLQCSGETTGAPHVIFGRPIKSESAEISSINLLMGRATICGSIDTPVRRELKDGGVMITFNVEDPTSAMAVNVFAGDNTGFMLGALKAGDNVLVRGSLQDGRFAGDVTMRANSINRVYLPKRKDSAPEKRVELHCHTIHSVMDSTATVSQLVERAAAWGHKAIAITDHASLCGIIEGCREGKKQGIKVICGMEGYYVNDNEPAVYGDADEPFSGCFTVFDIETTGFSTYKDRITEIGAVRVENGKVIDTFSQLVNPQISIPSSITELTGISNEMVENCPSIDAVLPDFLKFAQGSILVAHNANFDCGFISANAKRIGTDFGFTYIDTVPLCRSVFPELSSVKLNKVAEHMGLGNFNHHRACDDAQMLSKIFVTLLIRFKKNKDIDLISKLNDNLSANLAGLRRHHINILTKNQEGLSDLYRIVSKSNIDFNFRRPVIPKSLLMQFRRNLLIGSACSEGELFELISEGRSYSEIYRCADFYDFYELQPLCNNMHLVDSGKIADTEALRKTYREIIKLGAKFERPVVATGDVHFLDEDDMAARAVLCSAKNIRDEQTQGPLYFKTTNEMLDEFAWLGEDIAENLVIKNTVALAGKCHRVSPLPEIPLLPSFTKQADVCEQPGLFSSPEKLENTNCMLSADSNARAEFCDAKQSAAATNKSTMSVLCVLVRECADIEYGNDVPALIKARIEKELEYIEQNNLAAIFITAKKIVDNIAGHFPAVVLGYINKFVCSYLIGITGALPNMQEQFEPCHKDVSDGADNADSFHIELSVLDECKEQISEIVSELFGDGHCVFSGRAVEISQAAARAIIRTYEENTNTVLREAAAQKISEKITGAYRAITANTEKMFVLPENTVPFEIMPLAAQTVGKAKRLHTHFLGSEYDGIFLKLILSSDRGSRMLRLLERLTGIDANDIMDDEKAASLYDSCKAMETEDELLPNGLAGIDYEGIDDTVKYRLVWYKLYYPQAFYCVYFSTADHLDMTVQGPSANVHSIKRAIMAADESTDRDKLAQQTVAFEMMQRGFSFKKASLIYSDSVHFIPCGDNTILLPLISIEGLGKADAAALVQTRQNSDYLTAHLLVAQSGISKAAAAILNESGLLSEMDDMAQPKLF